MADQPRDAVTDYFEREAAGYDGLTESGPLRLVRRLESDAVFARLGDVSDQDVLEIGCGAGFYTRRLLQSGARHVWAVDLSAAMLRQLEDPRITTVQGDAAAFRLERKFPVILSAGVIEFLPDPAGLFANAAGHAEPGARMVVFGPRPSLIGRIYRRFHRRHGFEINLFDGPALSRLATDAGWRPVRISFCPPFGIIGTFSRV